MNKFVVFFASLLSVVYVHAAAPMSEICKLEERETSDFFTSELVFDADKPDANPPKYVDLLERAVSEILNSQMNYEQIKAAFTDGGDEEFNDLYMTELVSNLTGKTYVQVLSYPGDNPYGLFFDAQTKKVVGAIEDGDYSILVNGKKTYCTDLN